MRDPSGDHLGRFSPPGSEVRRRRLLPSAPIAQMSKLPSTSDSNAIVLPSGDQAGAQSKRGRCRSGLTSPVATSTMNRSPDSVLSWFPNTILVPSGDQLARNSPPGIVVSARAPVPSGCTSHRSDPGAPAAAFATGGPPGSGSGPIGGAAATGCSGSDVYAIQLPSGDQSGIHADAGPCTTARALPPSASATQISPTNGSFSVVQRVYAILPSGPDAARDVSTPP